MKKFSEQLKKRADSIKMSTTERNELRERLLSYMEYHPLPESQTQGFNKLRFARPGAVVLALRNRWLVGRVVGSFVVLMLVVVPAMAENALPGDVLYPIKVRFNEEVRGAMNSSPYQKIEWETERLERRLAEAELLAEGGRLTPDAEADVAEAIKKHTEAARASIDTIRQSDKDEAAIAEISLSSSLDVSEEIWTKRDAGIDGATSTHPGAVSRALAALSPEFRSDEPISYAKLFSRVEAETTRAQEYFDSLDSVISEEETEDVNRRLTDLQVKIDSAALMKEEDEAGAAVILIDALGSVRKLISFMTKLEVRNSVTIEELVPLEPTEAEREEIISQKLNDAAELVAKTEAGLGQIATSSNDYIAISDTISEYWEIDSEARDALEAEDLALAEVVAASALELAEALRDTMIGLGINLETTASSSATSSATQTEQQQQ